MLTPPSTQCAVVLPGETCVHVGTHQITGIDLAEGQIENVATASGTAFGSTLVSAPAASVTTATIGSIPALDRWGLLAMLLALAGVAILRMSRLL